MLRSWKFTALMTLALTAGVLSGCSATITPNGLGGPNGPNDPNINDKTDLVGPALGFGGHWTGNCAANIGGVARTDCSMDMYINQATGLAMGTLSLNGTISIGSETRSFRTAIYGINGNNLQGLSGQAGTGFIGANAFRLYEDQFNGLAVKAMGKDSKQKSASRIAIQATQAIGYSNGAGCSGTVCFKADLGLQLN